MPDAAILQHRFQSSAQARDTTGRVVSWLAAARESRIDELEALRSERMGGSFGTRPACFRSC
jgi:hypothetical protein